MAVRRPFAVELLLTWSMEVSMLLASSYFPSVIAFWSEEVRASVWRRECISSETFWEFAWIYSFFATTFSRLREISVDWDVWFASIRFGIARIIVSRSVIIFSNCHCTFFPSGTWMRVSPFCKYVFPSLVIPSSLSFSCTWPSEIFSVPRTCHSITPAPTLRFWEEDETSAVAPENPTNTPARFAAAKIPLNCAPSNFSTFER